jgi:hypothetical protein
MILPLVATAAVLAGCGGGGSSSNGEASKSATAILADAKQAARDAGSARVTGTIHDSGQTIGLDLKITGQGGGGSSGTLKLSDWGSVTAPTAPKNAIDIGALGK